MENIFFVTQIDNQWLVGIVVALLGGLLFSGATVSGYRRDCSCFFNGVITGLIERFFFMIGIAFNLPGIGVAMIVWIAAKMAAGWNQYKSNDPTEEAKSLRMAAIMGGAVSMLFATIGGLICAGKIQW